MGQMKRIKHDDAGPLLEVRSPMAGTIKLDKPSTHHGYVGTHHQNGMANTEPLNNAYQPNITSNSFNARSDPLRGNSTANVGFLPELSIASNFCLLNQVNMLKPILRRNCLHNRNNIVLQWKSFEIQIVKLEYASTADTLTNKCIARKLLNPVYVPISELNHLL